MRNFESRKQEILRRAGEKLRRRRKVRNHCLGIGIPLACLAVCIVLSRPDLGGGQKKLAYQESAMDAAPIMTDQLVGEIWRAELSVDEAPTEDHTHALAPAEEADPQETQPIWYISAMGQSDTQYRGVFLEESKAGMTTHPIEFLCHNQTDQTVAFEGYDLQRLVDDQWIDCQPRSQTWSPETFEVIPENQGCFTYFYLDQRWFQIPDAGQYRMVAYFRVGNDSTLYSMWAEFTLEEGA